MIFGTRFRVMRRILKRSGRYERDLNKGFPRLLQEQSNLGASRQHSASEPALALGFLSSRVRRLDLSIPKSKHVLHWPRVAANARLLPKVGGA